MNMEMELEDLRTMIELLKDTKDEQFILIGQLNHISEASVRMELVVSTKVDYDSEPVLVTYREPIGTERLPYDDSDQVGQQKINDMERNMQMAKEKVKKQLADAGFSGIAMGVWKKI
jgi:hypothetical protein